MTKTATPTQANRGLLPSGSTIDSGPYAGARIIEVSLTAYRVAHVGISAWLSFDAVHGRPTPATPLLGLG